MTKLADFGAAKQLAHRQLNQMESHTVRDTPYFMAPEVFEEKYDFKADIWSVGCVAFQMATASPPWKRQGFQSQTTLFLHLQKTEGPLDWPSGVRQTDQESFEKFVGRCFWWSPQKRPTAHDARGHH